MKQNKVPFFISVQEQQQDLLYNVDYGDGPEEVLVFRDLALNTQALPQTLQERIALRNLPISGKISYSFRLHGGLGDVLMGIQAIRSLKEFFRKNLIAPEIVGFFLEKDFKSLSKWLESTKTFHKIFTIESLKTSEPEFLHPPLVLNAGPEPIRPENLGIGSYHNFLWSTWGLPGKYEQVSLNIDDFAYIRFAKNKFRDYLKRYFPQLEAEKVVLFFPLGFGLMNRWKTWPEENWLELAHNIRTSTGLEIIVSADRPELLPALKESQNINWINHKETPEFDFDCLAGAIASSALSISVDTGPAHIAPIVGRSSIVLFGPTNPIIYGQPSNDNIRLSPCHPCYFTSQTLLCGRNECMEDNDVKSISELALKKIIQGS
jgi:ADP-heptose:LPS heptosyltransferase